MNNPARGFTLLELLVVLGLLSVTAMLATLRIPELLDRWRLNAAARQVILDLKLARAHAIGAGVNHRVRFTVPGAAYQPQRQVGTAMVNDGPAVELPSGIRVTGCSAAGGAITFRPRGQALTFGSVTLADAHDRWRRIVVDIAGRMRVER